jgi:HEPN domain-containing protein
MGCEEIGEVTVMFDKVQYWLDLCDDNLITAKWLLEGKRYLDMAFFCHQITEKALKAVVASVTVKTPPKTHDLHKLAKLGNINEKLSDEQRLFLDDISKYLIAARYPETKDRIAKTLTDEKCKQILEGAEGFLCWIKKLLKE